MKWITLLLLISSCAAQDCKTLFSIVTKDELNNVQQSVSADTTKWLQKMQKKYPGLCYAPGTKMVFYISAVPATYDGTRIVTHSSPITGSVYDQYDGEQVGTIRAQQTTSTAVPYSVRYRVLLLSVMEKTDEGKWKVLHNFQGKTLHPVFYGICTRNCHPTQALIENAMKWVYSGGPNDPLQSVVEQ